MLWLAGQLSSLPVEAATRRPDSEKARRIVAAMRESVGARGTTGSTFDQVAQEAGVSRGLLHYYFGSKERLLVEVVRHDCELRIQNMDERIARATTVGEIIAEVAATRITERGATRADDRFSEAAMEDRKREGYF